MCFWYCACQAKFILKRPTLANVFETVANRSCFAHFWQGAQSLRLPHKTTSISKDGPSMWCFQHFYFQMCSTRQQRALFEHLNSQSAPNLTVFNFNVFDFEMCFAPQRRPLFPHLNFQKCSEHVVFCAF